MATGTGTSIPKEAAALMAEARRKSGPPGHGPQGDPGSSPAEARSTPRPGRSRREPASVMIGKQSGADNGSTVAEAVKAFETRGYRGQFRARQNAEVECLTCHRTRPARRYHMDYCRRVEGQSDPESQSLVAAITCECGAKGTEVFTYGPGADAAEMQVLSQIHDERKRPETTDDA